MHAPDTLLEIGQRGGDRGARRPPRALDEDRILRANAHEG
jgi:hypothetical protein